MALPTTSADSWTQDMPLPSRLFGTGSDDYELYEADGEFVLSIEMPGFDPEEIEVAWHDGRLNIAAEHEDERRGRRETYHRSFRFPSEVDESEVAAQYQNGVLEVTLPTETDVLAKGTSIPIES